MPANLTPDYMAAEERFRAATTPEEKLEALEEMLATIPKHKGTEKMQADIKRRIARIRDESQRRSGSRKRPFYILDRQGAGQVVLTGPPNSGKSQILASLSNAQPDVAPYPFTTRAPLAGMVQYENVQVQLIDLPPLAPEGSPPWLGQVIRSADAVLLVLDVGDDDVLDHLETTLVLLERSRITLCVDPGQGGQGGATLAAGGSGLTGPTIARKRAILVANKLDAPGAADRLELLMEATGSTCPIPVQPVSALMGTGLETLRKHLFDLLDVIRVYTKAPGKTADFSAPFVLKRGTTVVGAAAAVHKDIARNLKYARVWGKRTFEGQMVQRDYVLEEGDVIEFHT
ncbi:MAG: TGS domain-containing protein [Firmicutes bacterium]|nr:TGS domain-containing protein [Bacillota bacterium]